MAETGEKKDEESKKIVHTYPLVRNCDMGDEMKTEAMELCVTACEKHAANNEPLRYVLIWSARNARLVSDTSEVVAGRLSFTSSSLDSNPDADEGDESATQ